MGGSSAPEVPPMSKQEKDLMSQQTDLLKQQQIMTQHSFDTQNLLAPFLYKELGLTPTMDDKGNITGFSQDPNQTAISNQQTQITKELLDRQQQALEGKVPLDAGLVRQMNESEAQLHSSLLQSLGPGYETSTSGATALDRFQQTKLSTFDAARRGDLSLAEQLALGMQQGQDQHSGFLASGAGAQAGMGANYGAMFGQAAHGLMDPMSILENTRSLQYDANKTATASQNAMLTGLGSGVGNLVGTLGSAWILSSSEFKEDLGPVDILDNVKRLPIRRWKYKKEMGQGEEPHIGPYAEDFKKEFGVGDGKVIALVDYMGVQLAATKKIAEKLDDLADALFLKEG